ncbi:MAG: hypothetical protein ACYSTX_04620 [Planctomycetota bacterium]|jgi:hypothetical protein
MTECKTDKMNRQLLDKLHSVLEKQTRMARKGNLIAVEDLTKKADVIVEEIARASNLEQIKQTNRWKKLETIYQQLTLILASQKYSIEQQIKQIRDGRKTLQAYKVNH